MTFSSRVPTTEEPRLTIGSLFSGIGGLELGLERAGLGPVVWQVEKDDYARRVLAKHWPDATRYEDVRDVGGHNLAAVDVICGGFPCQDISVAGAGAGLGGERSGLWSEYARIVGELRPGYVVVENVAALLVRGLSVVLGDLAALGYDAWWDCIPAVAVGAPHRRDRLFLVAHADDAGLEASGAEGSRDGSALGGRRGRSEHIQTAEGSGSRPSALADTASRGQSVRGRPPRGERYALRGDREGAGREAWLVEPDVGRVAHGVPARVDRLRALGNAVVPQVAEVVGRVILQLESLA